MRALSSRIIAGQVPRLALVGGGGSGKSLLACALGHRLRPVFPGGVHWLRVGAWDPQTLYEMLARRLGLTVPAQLDDDRLPAVRRALEGHGRALVVLDNHESDRSLARFLEAMRGCPVVWIITARRCLLSGVEVFPVIPPMVTTGRSAFPRVSSLTKLLRWNALALDVANSLVTSRAASASALRAHLIQEGVERVSVMAHEDDVPEVRLLLDWAWQRLPSDARRMMAVLAHTEGDDIDADSLRKLALAKGTRALDQLRRWHLVQEPLAGRFTVHAVIRYAVTRRTRFSSARFFQHYVRLLERHPDRIDVEQTHLFAAMDQAQRASDLDGALRIERLLSRLGG